MAGRLRSGLPLLRRAIASSFDRSVAPKAVRTNPVFSRNYASAPPVKEQIVKVPVTLFGVTGNYASALYIAAVKANVLETVESELVTLMEAAKKAPMFSQFLKDLSVNADTRVKALTDICEKAKFAEITTHFLLVVSKNGRLRELQQIVERFSELTMVHRGEVKATVTTVIPLPEQEEKELKETLQDILGHGKKVIIEQKIDHNILGGIIVEFDQKVFDTSMRTRARQFERFLRQQAV